MERQVSRLRPTFLEGRWRNSGRTGFATGWEQRSLCAQWPAPSASLNFVTAHDGFTCATSSVTITSTTKPTAKRIVMGRTITRVGTAGSRVRRRCRRSTRCERSNSETCSPRSFFRRVCRCCWPATSLARLNTATITPIARTHRLAGSIGSCPLEQQDLLEFTRQLIQLRRTQPVFRRRHFFQGRPIHGGEIKDLYWLKPDGTEMSDADWNTTHARCIGMVLPGDQITETGEEGERIVGDSFAGTLERAR